MTGLIRLTAAVALSVSSIIAGSLRCLAADVPSSADRPSHRTTTSSTNVSAPDTISPVKTAATGPDAEAKSTDSHGPEPGLLPDSSHGHHSVTITNHAVSITSDHGKSGKIHCIDPHTCCRESEQVLKILHQLIDAYIHGDVDVIAQHLDDHCTTFEESTRKLVSGKTNVLADIQGKLERYSPKGETPLLSFTIDHPYAKVMGDTAVVTFVAYRELGGKHPIKEMSKVTDVFVKKDGTWKKLHYRGHWRRI